MHSTIAIAWIFTLTHEVHTSDFINTVPWNRITPGKDESRRSLLEINGNNIAGQKRRTKSILDFGTEDSFFSQNSRSDGGTPWKCNSPTLVDMSQVVL
jgi:hypothetical protein